MSPDGADAVSPARACAFTVVRRVFEQGAYADRALAGEAGDLDRRDRALATQIAYGTVQRKATLDHIAGRVVHRPLARLEPPVLAAIRIGLFQLAYLDGVAAHAAVNESVELAKRTSPGGARLVNAALRTAARERGSLLDDLDDRTAAQAAIKHSVPRWLAEMWWDELGAQEARALLAGVNRPAESAIRVNRLASTVEDVIEGLAVNARRVPELPEGLVLEGPFDAHGSELWEAGSIMPQSRGSMLIARLLAPAPGERVLDLCAAPGAKTTHLGALMEDRGELVAVERHPGRARALEQTVRRMRLHCARVEVADASEHLWRGAFDGVLVDPPCSGLGTLQSRPDIRWRAEPGAIEQLAARQERILAAGAAATRAGGTLVYSVCTISRREGPQVVDAFLRSHPEWEAEDLGASYPRWREHTGGPHLQLLPHRDGTDGFFAAKLRRGGR